MPKVKKNSSKNTPPVWAQDELDRFAYLQGGGHLEKSKFTLPNSDGINVIYSGTLVGRTYAEKEAGIGYGPANVYNDEAKHDDGQIFLLIHDVDFDDEFFGADGQCSLYRHGCQVAETSIPGWATMDVATKAKIRALYQVV